VTVGGVDVGEEEEGKGEQHRMAIAATGQFVLDEDASQGCRLWSLPCKALAPVELVRS
jgi:hypothetical protein